MGADREEGDRLVGAVDDLVGALLSALERDDLALGEIAQYEDIYRLCFVRGPEGIVIGLAEQLS